MLKLFSPETFPFASVFSERSYVVRTQGLNGEVTRQSKASMQNEGIAAPKSALAQRRHTTAPKKRTQNPTQKVRAVVWRHRHLRIFHSPRI